MSAEPQKDCLHDSIFHVLGNEADADAVAAATVRAVESLMGELKPLVGRLATLALYTRSLHLANASFARPDPTLKPEDDLASLRTDLLRRSPEDARRASHALLRALVDLLVSLIGQSLTDRMLRSAWGISNDERPTKEMT